MANLICNRPVKSTRPGKKFTVRACVEDRERLLHFGAEGYGHNYSTKARRSFKARHRCATAKDKLTPRFWACRFLWAGPDGKPPRRAT